MIFGKCSVESITHILSFFTCDKKLETCFIYLMKYPTNSALFQVWLLLSDKTSCFLEVPKFCNPSVKLDMVWSTSNLPTMLCCLILFEIKLFVYLFISRILVSNQNNDSVYSILCSNSLNSFKMKMKCHNLFFTLKQHL